MITSEPVVSDGDFVRTLNAFDNGPEMNMMKSMHMTSGYPMLRHGVAAFHQTKTRAGGSGTVVKTQVMRAERLLILPTFCGKYWLNLQQSIRWECMSTPFCTKSASVYQECVCCKWTSKSGSEKGFPVLL